MKVTPLNKHALACRSEQRRMLAAGWERIGEGGGELWQLYRGGRVGHVITEVRIAHDGISLWIRTSRKN